MTRSAAAGARRDRAAELYDHHGARLYRQAFLALGDERLAEQVVTDVLVEACLHPGAFPRGAPDTRGHLAVSAYQRCRDLAGAATQPGGTVSSRPALDALGCGDPGGLARGERDALGLVLFGGLGYAQAGRELALPAGEMASLLHSILVRLAAPAPGAGPALRLDAGARPGHRQDGAYRRAGDADDSPPAAGPQRARARDQLRSR